MLSGFALDASPALAQSVAREPGLTCGTQVGMDYSIQGQASPPDTTGNSSTTGNNLICDGSHWQYPALIAGNIGAGGTAVSCATGTAGAIEWTGSALQYCNGTSWSSLGAGGGTALSGLTAAAATNSINNAAYSQTWTWNTITSSNALTLSSSSETTGSLLALSNTNTNSNTGSVLTVTDSAIANTAISATESGSSGGVVAVYASASNTGNSGYAVQAVNNSTNGWGIYSSGTSPNYFAGSVGIGTSAPGYPLHVYTTSTLLQTRNQATGTNSTVEQDYNTDSVQSQFTTNQYGGFAGIYTNNQFYLMTNNQPRLLIQAGGNVGIGTASPATKLDINGTLSFRGAVGSGSGTFSQDAINGISFEENFTNTGGYLNTTSYSLLGTSDVLSQATPASTAGYYYLEAWNSSGLVFGTGGTPSTSPIISRLNRTEAMRITTSGNVGIGTTSPNTNLDLGTGYFEWGGESRVTSTFSKTSSTTLSAITGLSATLTAGKTYYFDILLYTTANSAGGIQADLNGGTATATSIIGDGIYFAGGGVNQVRISALNTNLCNNYATSLTCHITGTITVNAGGTLIPRFAQAASSSNVSTVAVGSIMIVHQIN